MHDPDYSHLAHANDLEPSLGHRIVRERCPVHTEAAHDPPFHVIGRHADVFDVLMRPGEWCNGYGVGVYEQDRGVLGTADDPDHRRQRKVLQDAFLTERDRGARRRDRPRGRVIVVHGVRCRW